MDLLHVHHVYAASKCIYAGYIHCTWIKANKHQTLSKKKIDKSCYDAHAGQSGIPHFTVSEGAYNACNLSAKEKRIKKLEFWK
jgi:hypothetical protein